MARARNWFSLAALAVLWLLALWLGRLEAAGPLRVELVLAGGLPATLHLPEAAEPPAPEVAPPVPGLQVRPPAIALAHGYASDRANVSALARSLTQAGYAVLTFDFAGHGANRNPLLRSRGAGDGLLADFRTAVDWLRTSSQVDGHRIVVMGHSMGASAALAFAGREPGIDATVLISGGREIEGPHWPPNALFLVAEGDPERIRMRVPRLAARLAGLDRIEAGTVHGDFASGTATTHVEVARADHVTILTSQYAAREIISWLDRVYGFERSTFFLRADPRVSVALFGVLAFACVLPGLGALLARLDPAEPRPGTGALVGLLPLAAALAFALPLVAVGEPGAPLRLDLADQLGPHFFASGVLLWLWLVASGRADPRAEAAGLGAALMPAAAGLVAVYFLLAPFGAALHRLSLTPERGLQALLLALLFAPFLLAFHFLLRRGSWPGAAFTSLLGRALVVGVLVVSVLAGVLPPVVFLMLPILVVLFLLFEVLAIGVHAASGSYRVVALVEAGWLAWIFAAVLPVLA